MSVPLPTEAEALSVLADLRRTINPETGQPFVAENSRADPVYVRAALAVLRCHPGAQKENGEPNYSGAARMCMRLDPGKPRSNSAGGLVKSWVTKLERLEHVRNQTALATDLGQMCPEELPGDLLSLSALTEGPPSSFNIASPPMTATSEHESDGQAKVKIESDGESLLSLSEWCEKHSRLQQAHMHLQMLRDSHTPCLGLKTNDAGIWRVAFYTRKVDRNARISWSYDILADLECHSTEYVEVRLVRLGPDDRAVLDEFSRDHLGAPFLVKRELYELNIAEPSWSDFAASSRRIDLHVTEMAGVRGARAVLQQLAHVRQDKALNCEQDEQPFPEVGALVTIHDGGPEARVGRIVAAADDEHYEVTVGASHEIVHISQLSEYYGHEAQGNFVEEVARVFDSMPFERVFDNLPSDAARLKMLRESHTPCLGLRTDDAGIWQAFALREIKGGETSHYSTLADIDCPSTEYVNVQMVMLGPDRSIQDEFSQDHLGEPFLVKRELYEVNIAKPSWTDFAASSNRRISLNVGEVVGVRTRLQIEAMLGTGRGTGTLRE